MAHYSVNVGRDILIHPQTVEPHVKSLQTYIIPTRLSVGKSFLWFHRYPIAEHEDNNSGACTELQEATTSHPANKF